jgi:Coenzyme PQQ synthesis protein D (PqqD)
VPGEVVPLRLRPAGLRWRRVDDEVIVLDTRRSVYLQVNGTGAQLWPLLVDGTDEEALADALAAAHGLVPEVARRDVERFVAELRDKDLLG